MKVLLDSNMLSKEFFCPSHDNIGNNSYAFEILSKGNIVQAFVTERGINSIYQKVLQEKGMRVAQNTISFIKGAVEILPKWQNIFAEDVSLSSEKYLDIVTASEHAIRVIFTHNAQEFRRWNPRILTFEEWLPYYFSASLPRQEEFPLVIQGQLRDIQRLSEFSHTAASPNLWDRNLLCLNWERFNIPVRGRVSIAERKRRVLLGAKDGTEQQASLTMAYEMTEHSSLNFEVTLQCVNSNIYLDSSTSIELLGKLGNIMMIARPIQSNCQRISLTFEGETGDLFSIRVTLKELSYIEDFLI